MSNFESLESHLSNVFDYQITIPSLLLEIDGVTRTDLKLYSLVKSLSRQKGYCYATNEYLGEILGMNDRNVQKYLGRLKKLGMITCEVKRAGVQTSRKIYLLDDPRKRQEIYKFQNLNKHVPNETSRDKTEIQKQIKHVPNETPGGVPNVTGGDVPNVTPRLEEYKTNKKIQQQDAHTRDVAAAAFSEDLLQLGISQDDCLSVTKEFSRDEIAAAVAFVKQKISIGKCDNPGGMLISCLREKWKLPPKEAAPPPQTEDAQAKYEAEAKELAESNKKLFEELDKKCKLKEGHSMRRVLGDIVIKLPNGAEDWMNYESRSFKQKLKKYYELQ